ncbi:MAG: lipopolysaccharide biosynthesis protein [Bacteroidales bacterium]|nr:lipopolysaccharide biosynthesis protein [Bacteroidales bacterium]
MISKKFLQSSLIYSVVGALPYASGFILILWFTRYLTPAQFGLNVLYISLMYFIQIISTFGLDMSAAIMSIDYKDEVGRLKRFIGTVLLGLILIGGMTFILFLFGGFQLFNHVFSKESILILLPFGLFTIISAVLNGVFKTYSSFLIYQQRPVRFFWLNIFNFLMTIGVSLLLLYLYPFTLYGPILGRLIAAVFTSSITFFLIAKEYGFQWERTFFKPIFSFSSPLMLYAILLWTVSYIDRFILLRFLNDPVPVGIYDFGVKIVLLVDLLQVGLVNTINPIIFRIWKDQNLSESTVEVNRYYNGLTAFTLVLIPLLVLLTPIIIPFLISNAIYYQAFGLLAVLAAGYASRIWTFMFMAPLLFFKRTYSLPKVFGYSAIFEVIAAIVLIHFFGLMGAVWVNFLVKPIQAFFLYLEARKVFTFRFNKWKILYLPIIFMVVVLSSEILITDSTRLLFHAGQLLLSCTMIYFIYRKEMVFVVKNVLNKRLSQGSSPR